MIHLYSFWNYFIVSKLLHLLFNKALCHVTIAIINYASAAALVIIIIIIAWFTLQSKPDCPLPNILTALVVPHFMFNADKPPKSVFLNTVGAYLHQVRRIDL